MHSFFPDNYNWSLAVALGVGMGGELTEIDTACEPLRPLAAAALDDASQAAWFDAWTSVAERLAAMAAADASEGRQRSAGRFDHLVGRGDIDPDRIALAGISMGGYFAPRAAAFEPRIAACVAWGAFFDLVEVAANLATTGAHSAPPFQVPWVFGITDRAALARHAAHFTLDGVAEKITCPLLVIHGAADRQVPVDHAHRTIDHARNAARRDLVVFPEGTWGDQHCQVDDPTLAVDLIADWLQEVLLP